MLPDLTVVDILLTILFLLMVYFFFGDIQSYLITRLSSLTKLEVYNVGNFKVINN
jgi:hypothetical protein